MFKEIALSRRQFMTVSDLKDGSLAIAYLDGSQVCISTTGSSTVYAWINDKWVPYKQAPKSARFGR
jgi:hypothetical protein